MNLEQLLASALGGGLFGAATVAVLACAAWVGRALISQYLAGMSQQIQSELKRDETRFDQVLKASIDFKARQLTEFYWPVYVRLLKDNAVWDRILDRDKSDPIRQKVAQNIDNSEILPNHILIVQTIEAKIHLAQADAELQSALMQYVRHVAVYKAMRQAGITDRDPITLGERWPAQLFPLVQARTEQLQREYDELVGSAGLSHPAAGPRLQP